MKKYKKIIVSLLLFLGIGGMPYIGYAESIVGAASGGSHQTVQLANGKFAVISRSDSYYGDIYQQVYNADYTKDGDPVYIGTGRMERDAPQVIATLTGNATVAYVFIWDSLIPSSNGHRYVKIQRFRNTGRKYGPPILVDSWKFLNQGGYGPYSTILPLANGKWEVFYHHYTGTYKRRIYEANGAANSSVTVSNDAGWGGRFFTLKGGGFLQVWGGSATPIAEIKFQRYNSNGAPVGSVVNVRTTTRGNAGGSNYAIDWDVQPLKNGRFVISWAGGHPNGYDLAYLQKFYSNGSKWGGETIVSSPEVQVYAPVYMAEVGNSGWVVTWMSSMINHHSPQMKQRRYTSTGVAQSIQLVGAPGSSSNSVGENQVVSKSNGGWSVAYSVDYNATIKRQDYTSTGALDGVQEEIFTGAGVRVGLTAPLKNFNYLSKPLFLTYGTIYSYINLDTVPQGLDIGLRLKESSGTVSIAAEVATAATSPLRISKGGVNYSLLLVDPLDACASATRIKTSSGIMALQKYGCGEGTPDPVNGGWTSWRPDSLGTSGYTGPYDYDGPYETIYNKYVLNGYGGNYCIYKINEERFCVNLPPRYGGNDCSSLDGGNNSRTISGYAHKQANNRCLSTYPSSTNLHACLDTSSYPYRPGDYDGNHNCIGTNAAP